ncbi:hypothetical protein CANARDRAFT_8892 [[Candida] arabinofermentans NRRL YB-2248]|uniref:Conserved oligomeric Golgi complex subunit 6 n=1 Tax=[Candida] arabinofermentans NRRL YB-2248 TaxID=983967 RepID=A0A1E4SXL2_9ASCO|nr:hypothetical protein CANARDRAFT_8892 [[Candida] arabinofermentans NRRL YB-2248]
MDFVFDTYDESFNNGDGSSNNSGGGFVSSLPVPSAPLKIPSFHRQSEITRKFSNLNILKSINGKSKSNSTDEKTEETNESTLAVKYAKVSLDLISSASSYTPSSNSSLPINQSMSLTDSHALGARLSRVLNQTSFDSSIRQSLLILQARADQNEQGNSDYGMDYKNLTGPNVLGSISRRKLRGDIENDLLRQHFQSLKKFQLVASKLNLIKQDLDDLNSCFDEIDGKVTKNIEESKDFKNEVTELIDKRNLVKVKRDLLNSFKSNFTLTHYEEHILRNEKIDDEFFTVLDKVETIYTNCDILLSMDNDKLGISIMNQMSLLMDLATDRISVSLKKNLTLIYIQNDFKKDVESINNFQKSLIYILRKNKDKFDSIVSEIIESRSRIVTEEFIAQLNMYSNEVKSNKKGSIMVPSLDPKRFMSDMLAYLHSVIVNELELVEGLFNFDQAEITNGDLSLVIQSVVNKVLGSLSRPFKGACDSTIRQETKPVIIVELYQLLDLYRMMFSKLTEHNDLIQSLTVLQSDTIEKLFNLVSLKLKEIKIESDLEEVDEDVLGLPDWLIDFYSVFLPIFKQYSSFDDTLLRLEISKQDALFNLLIDEPIDLVLSLTKKLSISKISKKIFNINCIEFIASEIEPIPLLIDKLEQTKEVLNQLIQDLVTDEFTELLTNSGLYDIYNLVNMIFKLDDEFFDVSIYEPISENKLFKPITFQNADLKLHEYLIGYLISNELNKLISPIILNDIFVTSALRFVNFYYRLLAIVGTYLKDDMGNPMRAFTWDDIHVATLLGIEEAYIKQRLILDQ